MKGRARRKLTACIATTAFAVASQTALSFEPKLDTFSIQKNGTSLVLDTFSDGAPPPSADSELSTYLYPQGGMSEASGSLTLNPSTGPVVANAAGSPTRNAGATFSTNIGLNSTLGLRSSNTIRVSAVFELLPVPSIGDGYGIRLTDRNEQGLLGTTTYGDDVLELGVFRETGGFTRVVFRRQNFLSNTITAYSFQNALLSNAKIELILAKSSPDTNAGIEASYRYFRSDGTSPGLTEMGKTDASGNPIRAFSGEDWTRGEFFAVQAAPVPEPEPYAMLLAGLGLVAWRLRRATRNSRALRIA